MLAEDDLLVTMPLQDALRAAGYAPLHAPDAIQPLADQDIHRGAAILRSAFEGQRKIGNSRRSGTLLGTAH
ncbi:hypothetical protein [Sphingosinicella rhizophila]|uniref:Uncharacterized protein n=1 Tax=Sphingosinicella rhizophila TaxID=3050082 RepID=A0ABU3QA45_9SPHN|nr:hypothetical protein [Sphingosinicella sp. GR2756]MDT9600241.1 hypothetical protein [Sphingosinicella sp. GR2756]